MENRTKIILEKALCRKYRKHMFHETLVCGKIKYGGRKGQLKGIA